MINIKKPSKVSVLKKTPRCSRFYALVFSVILVFGLFNGFLVKNANASNNYFNNVLFYKGSDGYYRLGLHITTTLSGDGLQRDFPDPHCCIFANWNLSGGLSGYLCFDSPVPPNCLGTYTLTAGNTYQLILDRNPAYPPVFNSSYYIDNIEFWSAWPHFIDYQDYYFTEYPSLTITYPHDNDEIAGAFNIQGSYTIPAGSGYNYLVAGFFTPGSYDPLNFNSNVGAFGYDLATTTGNVLIPVNGIPAGYYDIYFRFLGSGLNYEPAPHILNVHLVNDIPPALPTGETPPTIQIYPPTAPETYHADYCAYGTSTTPLFNTLTGAVSGMITNIGQSLADFAGKFSLTDAQSTGQQLASSVLIMRSYVAGLNSFFGELPVGEILVLYLIVFVLVILFRVIKGLINLIKP